MLYSCTAVLKLFRSTEIRFSVPSSCALEILECLGRAELRIIFAHHQESRQRGAQLPLGLLEFFQLGRIGRRLARIELHLADAGPRVGHFGQRRFLEIRRAGHRADEVRDQIGAPLVDRLHIGPFFVHVLFEG